MNTKGLWLGRRFLLSVVFLTVCPPGFAFDHSAYPLDDVDKVIEQGRAIDTERRTGVKIMTPPRKLSFDGRLESLPTACKTAFLAWVMRTQGFLPEQLPPINNCVRIRTPGDEILTAFIQDPVAEFLTKEALSGDLLRFYVLYMFFSQEAQAPFFLVGDFQRALDRTGESATMNGESARGTTSRGSFPRYYKCFDLPAYVSQPSWFDTSRLKPISTVSGDDRYRALDGATTELKRTELGEFMHIAFDRVASDDLAKAKQSHLTARKGLQAWKFPVTVSRIERLAPGWEWFTVTTSEAPSKIVVEFVLFSEADSAVLEFSFIDPGRHLSNLEFKKVYERVFSEMLPCITAGRSPETLKPREPGFPVWEKGGKRGLARLLATNDSLHPFTSQCPAKSNESCR